MSTANLQLAASLAKSIVLELACPIRIEMNRDGESVFTDRNPVSGYAGQICAHEHLSAFQNAFLALLPYGIFQPLGPKGEHLPLDTFSVSYALRIDWRDVEDHVRAHPPSQPIDLHKLLVGFLGLGVHWNNVPTTRQWFQPRPELVSLIERLAEHGYAARLDSKFRWTDKIAPAMRDVYVWNAEGEDSGDALNALEEKIWNAMPEAAKHRYFIQQFDPLGFAAYFSECWDEEAHVWSASEPRGQKGLSGDGIGTAKRLHARYVKPYRY